MGKKVKNVKICSNCIEEFNQTEINIALVKSGQYSTLYCNECIKKLGITDFKPYKSKKKKID
ncbi:hypothetical protein M0Q97_04240 [Candidatus Dojkabacteria bacterium]|jgi:hypothetical protein|nr:hypothetical protein [Candidatus Dojkabacteria bacterium]